jgi:hypothetical protein
MKMTTLGGHHQFPNRVIPSIRPGIQIEPAADDRLATVGEAYVHESAADAARTGGAI